MLLKMIKHKLITFKPVATEGASPVDLCVVIFGSFSESCCLKVQRKVGDKHHLRLNIPMNPIANKYCEGKLQSTPKRELKRT